MNWWELVLSGLVDQLDKAIKAGADLAKISDNKHYMAVLCLIKWYKAELDELANKSETTIDNSVVEELYQVACAAWPD